MADADAEAEAEARAVAVVMRVEEEGDGAGLVEDVSGSDTESDAGGKHDLPDWWLKADRMPAHLLRALSARRLHEHEEEERRTEEEEKASFAAVPPVPPPPATAGASAFAAGSELHGLQTVNPMQSVQMVHPSWKPKARAPAAVAQPAPAPAAVVLPPPAPAAVPSEPLSCASQPENGGGGTCAHGDGHKHEHDATWLMLVAMLVVDWMLINCVVAVSSDSWVESDEDRSTVSGKTSTEWWMVSLITATAASASVLIHARAVNRLHRLAMFGAIALTVAATSLSGYVNSDLDRSDGDGRSTGGTFDAAVVPSQVGALPVVLMCVNEALSRHRKLPYGGHRFSAALHRSELLVLALLAYVLAVGAVFTEIEGFSIRDGQAFWLTTQTTVGYGLLVPTTTGGRWATFVFFILGAGLLGVTLRTVFNTLLTSVDRGAQRRLRQRERFRRRRREAKAARQRVARANSAAAALQPIVAEGPGGSAATRFWEAHGRAAAAVVLVVVWILAGAVVFYVNEDGWTYGNSVYCAFVTLTTIGYGDFNPERSSQLVLLLFLLPGLGAVAHLLGRLTEYVSRQVDRAVAVATAKTELEEDLREVLLAGAHLDRLCARLTGGAAAKAAEAGGSAADSLHRAVAFLKAHRRKGGPPPPSDTATPLSSTTTPPLPSVSLSAFHGVDLGRSMPATAKAVRSAVHHLDHMGRHYLHNSAMARNLLRMKAGDAATAAAAAAAPASAATNTDGDWGAAAAATAETPPTGAAVSPRAAASDAADPVSRADAIVSRREAEASELEVCDGEMCGDAHDLDAIHHQVVLVQSAVAVGAPLPAVHEARR